MMKQLHFVILSILIVGCYNNEKLGYYDSGELKFKVPLKDEKYHGEFIQYYTNGQIEAKINYQYGIKNGAYITFDSLGRQENLLHFKNGIKEGSFKIYYVEDKSIKVEGFYKNDQPDSLGFEYYLNGKVKGVYFYDLGKLSYLKLYDEKGNLIKSEISTLLSLSSDTLNIRLPYSYGDSNRIGVIIGSLDQNDKLLDTLDVLGTSEGNIGLKYKLPENQTQNIVSGKVFEIRMPDQTIIGETSFRYVIDSTQLSDIVI